MIDLVKVGTKIMNYRKLNHMTQEELADTLSVTRQALSKWELGYTAPSIDTLLALCQVFNTTFEDLLCLQGEEKHDINPDNMFEHHSRPYIIHKIVTNALVIDIPSSFYLFSNQERMIILRAIKDKKITCNLSLLKTRLTPAEQKYLFDKVYYIGGINI